MHGAADVKPMVLKSIEQQIGAALPDWLDGAGVVAGEVLVPVDLPGRSVRKNITMDEGLLGKIDRAARASGSTRSGFLAEAARAWLRASNPTGIGR
jgi:hypothetical protein